MHIILSESMTEPCNVIGNASVNLKKQVMTAFTAGSISGKCCQSMAVVFCIWIWIRRQWRYTANWKKPEKAKRSFGKRDLRRMCFSRIWQKVKDTGKKRQTM